MTRQYFRYHPYLHSSLIFSDIRVDIIRRKDSELPTISTELLTTFVIQ
jgi:hypothetical protein